MLLLGMIWQVSPAFTLNILADEAFYRKAPADNFCPASEPLAITVGSMDKTDEISDFSNYGRCMFSISSIIKRKIKANIT